MTEPGPDLIDATLGQYHIEALIGRGGMGYVYRARDTTLGRAVALKVLPLDLVSDASRLARFVKEARAASSLNHPHVVAVYEIRAAVPARDGAPIAGLPSMHYLAMELVTGDTVRALIENRRLDLRRTLDLFVQVAEALAAAHTAGVVHRDLKPENVMVSDSGYVKVLDFGLAKLRADLAADDATQYPTETALSGPGVLLGTVGYMSPEQAQGHPVDHRSDIFSFGCVLYEAVTGARAFAGSSTIDTLHKIVNVDAVALGSGMTSSPPELQRIVRKCLSKDPAERYQSIKDTAIDLRGLARELDSGSSVHAPAKTARSRSSRVALWAGSGAALAAAVIATAWFAARRPAPAASAPAVQIERMTNIGTVTDAALSPDRKYLVYNDSIGGKQSLWVRQLDGANPLQLIPPRAIGYWGAAFAPDSGSIFYAVKGPDDPGGSLYQIGLLGGTPRKILAGIDSGVTFAPDGRQLAYARVDYPDPGASALMIAGVDGANPHPLAIRHPPKFFAPGFFVAPSWSPDGKRIVASVRDSQARNARLVTISMDGTEQPLGDELAEIGFTNWLPDGSGVLFVARGAGLATGTGGQIWMQPFPRGTAHRVTTDLIDYRNAWISADGTAMLSVGMDSSPSLWSVPLDGHGEIQKINSLRYDGAAGVAWSKDGRILFTTPVRGEQQIWSMDADGSNRRAFTAEGTSVWPHVSPDGRFIAFAGVRQQQRGIWRMNPDGTGARLIAAVPTADHLDVTPDGRWITFSSALDGAPSLWRVASDGGTPERIVSLLDRASLSPDGSRVVGVRTENNKYSVAVLPISGGAPEWMATDVPASTGGGIFLFAPDGKGIYFTTAERANLWFHRFGETTSTQVTSLSEATLFNGAISPDGRSMLVTRGIQARDAFLLTNFR